jgi:hypothetical protein
MDLKDGSPGGDVIMGGKEKKELYSLSTDVVVEVKVIITGEHS